MMVRTSIGCLLLVLLPACSGGPEPPGAAPAPRPGPQTAEPSLPASRFAELDGARVHYVAAGAGERALVLVHGWASDHRVWEEQIETLGRSRRVIAIDLPGHGTSDPPRAGYSMNLFARAIAAVLDQERLERVALIGHSNGTPVIRQFYRIAPDRTEALVVVDGPLRQMFDARTGEGFVASFRGEDFSARVAATVEAMPSFDLTPDQVAAIRTMALEQPQHAVVGGLEASLAPEIWTADPIEVPMLVVLAAQPSWTEEYEGFVRRLAPSVDYRVMDRVSHFLMVERPGELNALVEAFLSQHDPTPP